MARGAPPRRVESSSRPSESWHVQRSNERRIQGVNDIQMNERRTAAKAIRFQALLLDGVE